MGKDAVVCNPNDWEMLLEEQGLPEWYDHRAMRSL